jgi:hypothetical protein
VAAVVESCSLVISSLTQQTIPARSCRQRFGDREATSGADNAVDMMNSAKALPHTEKTPNWDNVNYIE